MRHLSELGVTWNLIFLIPTHPLSNTRLCSCHYACIYVDGIIWIKMLIYLWWNLLKGLCLIQIEKDSCVWNNNRIQTLSFLPLPCQICAQTDTTNYIAHPLNPQEYLSFITLCLNTAIAFRAKLIFGLFRDVLAWVEQGLI